ncbi:MAG TPA: serpin family protein [Clostridiaceae bacterium]|nr:serpin family protein [Clostridiaceae bacterium]
MWSVPKFDVSSDINLEEFLSALGIIDIFSADTANFSPLTDEKDIFLSEAKQASRVAIDEKGLNSVNFTILLLKKECMPLGDEIDFIFYRPFVFVITGLSDLPLFVGIVNQF